MRRLLAFCFLAFAFGTQAQDIDVLHYTFVLRLNDTSDLVNGYTEIRFLTKENTTRVSFDLTSLGPNGKGMTVFDAQFIQPDKGEISFQHENNKITLLSSFKAGDSNAVAVWYKGIPSDGLIVSKNKYGDRTFFADNWPNRAHHWIPCNDKPDDKASFEFAVEAPTVYQVISNGVMSGKPVLNEGKAITHWREDIPSPTKVMVIGVAKFATKVFDDSPPGVPVSAWVYPQDSAKGFYDYALTPSILKFFSDYIGPFPYKKLANVQSKTVFGGMENASCIFYAESSVTGNRSEEDLMAHEIAHQWFGDAVSEKSFAHLWLSEGFATYLTNHYFEKKYGVEAAAKRWQDDREKVIEFSKAAQSAVVDSTSNLMSLLNANSYQKGAWVLRMLRQEVGDTAFQKIIQTFYARFKHANANSKEFETLAEEVCGKELTWFFDQWLYRPGVPKLFVSQTSFGNVIKVSVSQIGGAYKLPLRILLQMKNGKQVRHTLQISEASTVVSLPLPDGKLNGFIVDPDDELLYEAVTSQTRSSRQKN